MKKLAVITGTLALFVGLVLVQSNAAVYAEPDVVKMVNAHADKIGTMKSDAAMDAGKKLAPEAEESYLIMELMAKRKPGGKGGVGIGKTIGEVTPDGIEAFLYGMRKRIPDEALGKNNADAIRMAEQVAAIASINYHLCPEKAKKGKKDPKDWQKLSMDMYKHSLELAVALKAKNATKGKAAAKALNNTCVECHDVWR